MKKKRTQSDLSQLLKIRLNLFVLITTCLGFLCALRNQSLPWNVELIWIFLHTLIGTAAAAFGSAAFNQLMEIKEDSLMERTAQRPLPAKNMSIQKAFVIGWLLSGFGIIHLAAMVGLTPAVLATLTLITYVCLYTPLKKQSSLNTLIGAIPGALPPLIGWTAAGESLHSSAGWFLFLLLFLWQLPHFVSINWLCRAEYEKAGYCMWSNGDLSGKKSGILSAFFSFLLALISVLPLIWGFSSWIFCLIALSFGLFLTYFSLLFAYTGNRALFRKLFFLTLLYLPITLIALLFDWIPE